MCSFPTERKLSVLKKDGELNVSTSQNFTLPCNITKQSSNKSEFQVTWFWWNKTENIQRPIFTAYRNSTLQDRLQKGDQARFGRPLPNQFSLTVLNPSVVDTGLYFCEVEEWIQSLSHGWRKLTTEKSGILTVNVHDNGKNIIRLLCRNQLNNISQILSNGLSSLQEMRAPSLEQDAIYRPG